MSYRVIAYNKGLDQGRFACGEPSLDAYPQKQAGQDVRRRLCACFVAVEDERVVGYYTLATAGITLDELPDAIVKKLPRYPSIPAFRLGRLAVTTSHQGRGLGAALLADALLRALASPIPGFAMAVDALNEQAAAFYAKHGFVQYGSCPRQLLLPLAVAAKLASP